MSQRRPRLWETLRIDADRLGVEPSAVPGISGSEDIGIAATAAGFTVTNSSTADASVLVTLMAKATDAEAPRAREHLVSITSDESHDGPLRVRPEGDPEAYVHLWQDDIEVHEHSRGGWTATRSGIVVLPVAAGSSFVLAHDPDALRGGVVVAAVAAIGLGLVDVPLVAVDRGPAASLGELPDPRT